MTSNAGHVFISHGSENKVQAQELSAYLEQNGVKTWIAPRDVRPGMDYSEQLQEAIEQCAAFVILVTDKANKSPYVRAETEMAFSTNKPIFPVRMSDIMPAAGLALFLQIRHWTDAFGPERDANLERLARELQAIAGSGGESGDRVTAPPAWTSAPASARQPREPGLSNSTDEEEKVRAVVGPKAPFYLEKWRQMDAKGSSFSWNWAAFFLTIFWLGYRKLWFAMFGFLAFFIVLEVIGAAGGALEWLTILLLFGAMGLLGAFGNQLYRKQVRKIVAETDLPDNDRRAGLDRLQLRGGTSTAAVVSLIVLFLVYASIAAYAQQAQVENLANVSEAAAQEALEQSGTQAAPQDVSPNEDQPADQGGKPPADDDYPAEPYQENY